MNRTETRPSFSFSAPIRTLPRNLRHFRPAVPGLGFGFASVHEGPPPAVHEAEMRLATGMPPARRAEFLVGRCAAHRALRDAALPAGAVLRDGRRPSPPAGLVVSISHSRGVAVAVAAPAARFAALGVDLELSPLPVRAAHLVLRPAESVLLDGERGGAERRLLAAFSAKEAAYKAFSALLHECGEQAGDGDGAASAALPGLRAVHLRRHGDGFTARTPALPGTELDVTVSRLPEGVLSWALPRRS